jgi:RHS repeat-associated protein
MPDDDQHLARDGDNGTLYYLFGDHLGSTSVVANRDGTIKVQQLYKAFGEKRFPVGASTLPTTFRFTGQRQESFGLYFYQSRWYDPLLGRFAQADSVIPNP